MRLLSIKWLLGIRVGVFLRSVLIPGTLEETIWGQEQQFILPMVWLELAFKPTQESFYSMYFFMGYIILATNYFLPGFTYVLQSMSSSKGSG